MFDIETIERANKLYPICITYSNKSEYIFYFIENNSNEFLCNLILQNFNHNTYYYAHNLLFDFLLFLKPLNKLKIKFEWIFLNYKLYEVKIYHNNKIIFLRCSHKLLPFSLREFYPTFSNTEKLYFPYESLTCWNPSISCKNFPLINNTYYNLNLIEYIKLYNINDAKILKEGLHKFIFVLKEINIPFTKKNLSCSSISFNFYIKFFNLINLNLPKIHKNIINFAYFGGKCEVYGNPIKGEKILHFDFSGMYYNCMKECLPYGEFFFKNSNFNLEEPGYYYIEIEYYNVLPVLPIKTDKLYFKDGYICGWFWHEEILLTLKKSKIIKFKILHALISLKNDNILIDFLEILNKLKNDNTIKKQIGKLLINSFYGRLALGDEMDFIQLTHDLGVNKSYGVIDDLFIIKKKVYKNPKANIAIAAAIAAKARIKLYEAQLEILNSGGRLLYSDTDSVFAAYDINVSIENKLLGKHVYFDTLKTDTEIIDAVFISSKSYAVVFKNGLEIVKLKGINSPNVNFYDIKYKFFNNENYFIQENNQFSKKNFSLEHFLVSKEINLQNYDKRVFNFDKTNTSPHTIYI